MTLAGYELIESMFTKRQNGTEPKEVQVERGGFWARVFDTDPTMPLWQKTKTETIQVPHYESLAYVIGNKIIAPPSLMNEIREYLNRDSNSSYFRL